MLSTYQTSMSSWSSHVEGVAPVGLRPAGDAGPHLVAAGVIGRVAGQVAHGQRPGPDHAHVAPHHVHQGGQLVEAGGPQQPAQAGEPGLVGVGPVVAGLGGAHGAELHHLERGAVQPGPLLAEQHGRAHRHPDRHRHGQQHRPRHGQHQAGHHHVEHPRHRVGHRVGHRRPYLPPTRCRSIPRGPAVVPPASDRSTAPGTGLRTGWRPGAGADRAPPARSPCVPTPPPGSDRR